MRIMVLALGMITACASAPPVVKRQPDPFREAMSASYDAFARSHGTQPGTEPQRSLTSEERTAKMREAAAHARQALDLARDDGERADAFAQLTEAATELREPELCMAAYYGRAWPIVRGSISAVRCAAMAGDYEVMLAAVAGELPQDKEYMCRIRRYRMVALSGLGACDRAQAEARAIVEGCGVSSFAHDELFDMEQPYFVPLAQCEMRTFLDALVAEAPTAR